MADNQPQSFMEDSVPEAAFSMRFARFIMRYRFATLMTLISIGFFFSIPLNSKHRPLGIHLVSIGTPTSSLVHPREVFLPQVPVDPPYCLCLAPTLPAGVPCREIVLMAFDALVAANHQFDTRHPGGVFREDAARFYQENSHRIPFTREPFLVQERRADS